MKTATHNDTEIDHIASRLVEFCRRGEYLEAQKELFAHDAVSVEPEGSPMEHITKGLDAIAKKTESFEQAYEVHGHTVGDPIVAADCFACTMTLDATERSSGTRIPMSEICVYEVRDGKIVREQFFYEPKG